MLDEFLEQPATFIAETITGALAVGKTGTMVAGGRIVQALLKGKAFKQWHAEFQALRDAGRIPNDFAESKYGFQTWVELMTIIDEELPDADRLEALKAAFYAANKIGLADADRIRAYQLWLIAKRMRSGELVMLKALYNADGRTEGLPHPQWEQSMAERTGFGVVELVYLHCERLNESRLAYRTGPATDPNYSITLLGRQLFENIRSYELDLKAAGDSRT